MTTENQLSKVVSDPPSPQPIVPAANTSGATTNKGILEAVFTSATKYGILVAFLLYSIGFIIWRSYLAELGVSSVGFLQAEYISAAFCYILLVAGYIVAPVVFFDRLFKLSGQTEKLSFNILVGFWYFTFFFVYLTFFPPFSVTFGAARWVAVIGFLIAAIVEISNKLSRMKWGPKKMNILLERWDPFQIYYIVLLIDGVFLNPNVSKSFMGFTFVLYIPLALSTGDKIRNQWLGVPLKFKIVQFCLLAFVIVLHIKMFGSTQFGSIPRQVGGGKPEKAYVKFTPQKLDVPAALGIPCATNFGTTNGFFGPILILLRSDKEILFCNPANESIMWSNFVACLQTNVSARSVTNISSRQQGGGSNKSTSNIQTSARSIIIATNVTTNCLSYSTNIIRPQVAKQIRTDAIDVIVFESEN